MPTPITTAATTTTIKTINGFGRLFTRAFHATPVACTKHSKKRLAEMLKDLPQYPYPINRTFKQSWFGLYGGKHIQFGNNVPESRNKTRRSWLPNVREKKLYSECLGKFISVRMVASVLRKSCPLRLPNCDTTRWLTQEAGRNCRNCRQSWWSR